MWYLQTPRTAKKEGAWGSVKVRGSRGVKHFPGSHRTLGSVRQPTQALLPQPEWPPLSTPAPSLLLIRVVLEVDGPGVADETPLAGTAGGGWEYPPTHSLPIPVTLPEGAVGRSGLMVRRPLISSGRETGCTTQPPIVGRPYLGKFRLPHPEKAAGPPCPQPHLFASWRLESLAGLGSCRSPSVFPQPLRTRRSLDLAGRPGGSTEDRALQGLGLNWVSEEGSRGAKDELEGVRLEAGKGGGSGGREPCFSASNPSLRSAACLPMPAL